MLMTESIDSWRDFVAARGLDHDALRAREAVELFVEWYRTRRVIDVVEGPMGDALILQYGDWSWNDPRSFEYSITRQMIVADEEDDDAIWQLALGLHFERSDATALLASGQSPWCEDRDGLPELIAFIDECAATAFARSHAPFRVSLSLECAG